MFIIWHKDLHCISPHIQINLYALLVNALIQELLNME